MGKEVVAHVRIERDRTRLLFQSIAVPKEEEGQDEKSYKEKSDRAKTVNVSVEEGEDGDPNDDVLDVLSNIQPFSGGCQALIRNDLREASEKISDPHPYLDSLEIPCHNSHTLIILLLARQVRTSQQNIKGPGGQDRELEVVARCVHRAFAKDEESGITWEPFNSTKEKLTVIPFP